MISLEKPAYLTVTGQLHVEALIQHLGNTYTFGPTFRLKYTTRHAAEFWIEA